MTEDEQLFIRAIEVGDLAVCAQLLNEKKVRFNFMTEDGGCTPLYLAAEKGHGEIVRLFLEKEANPEIIDKRGILPLYIAIFNNHLDVVQLLLRRGVWCKEVINLALYLASFQGNLKIMECLLECNPNVDWRAIDDLQLLFLAEGTNWPAFMCLDLTPLMIASARGHVEAVRLLIKGGATINLVRERTVVRHVGHVCEFLKAEKKATDSENRYLNPAACYPLQTMKGGYIDANNLKWHVWRIGGTALFYASSQGNIDVVNQLLVSGADVDLVVNHGLSPLMIAAYSGYYDIVRRLYESGAKVDPQIFKHADTCGFCLRESGKGDIISSADDFKKCLAFLKDPPEVSQNLRESALKKREMSGGGGDWQTEGRLVTGRTLRNREQELFTAQIKALEEKIRECEGQLQSMKKAQEEGVVVLRKTQEESAVELRKAQKEFTRESRKNLKLEDEIKNCRLALAGLEKERNTQRGELEHAQAQVRRGLERERAAQERESSLSAALKAERESKSKLSVELELEKKAREEERGSLKETAREQFEIVKRRLTEENRSLRAESKTVKSRLDGVLEAVMEAVECPISHECMVDPVSLSDGHTYDRGGIEQWLIKHSTTPFGVGAEAVLKNKEVIPNYALQRLCKMVREMAEKEKSVGLAGPAPKP